MIRFATILLLASGVTLAAVPTFAQTAKPPRHIHKRAQSKQESAVPRAPSSGGINAPSTDFSKIERGDADSSGPDGPTLRPSVGAGGMGLGGSF